MAKLGPNHTAWNVEREGLDVLALLVELEDRQRVVLEQSFHEGSWDAVFDEARHMGALIRVIKRDVQQWYCKVVALIEAAKD